MGKKIHKTKMDIIAQTVKSGIIKSNLIPMCAGLTLALYTYQIDTLHKSVEILLAFAGSILLIGAAGALNNLYDRDIDSVMNRTKNRPTVTGEVNPKKVLWLSILMSVLGLGFLAFTTYLAAIIGLIGLFFYIFPYTIWSKRKTVYNTEIGSISGAMPPLIGWAAISPDISHPAIMGLFFITIIWQMPHFYSIAIRKQHEYKAANIPMLPVVKGMKRTYLQTNLYILAITLSSFLFHSLSIGLVLVSFFLGLIWICLSIFGYKRMHSEKWASIMFVYSLIYMTTLYSTVIIYSLTRHIF
uniref:heme o synthase n=1 Tax=Bacillus pumilus TaxID=1408 RepID=UPI003F4F4EA7